MEDQWLGGPMVDRRYNITPMTRWRWERNGELGFPKPLVINRRKYWSRRALEEWERSRAALKQ
jgi:hypothetical protein